MKFVILLAIIGFVAVSAAPTKEGLISKATELEGKLDVAIEKVKADHPGEARLLENEKHLLITLSDELEKATLPAVVSRLEQKLDAIEKSVEIILRRFEDHS